MLNGSYKVTLYYTDHVGAQLDTIDLVVPGVPYNSTLQVPFPAYAFNTELVTVSFDGAGNYSMSGTRNQAGVQSPISGTGTYFITTDRALTFDIGLTGNVLPGSNTFVLARASGAPVEIGVGVYQGGAYSNATLTGTYKTALYYTDHVGALLHTIDLEIPGVPYNTTLQVPFPEYAFNTELVTVSFDGAGNYSMSGTRNQAGVQSPISGTGTYSVAADGTLNIDIGLTGSVLPDGSTFVLASLGEPTEIGVGVIQGGAFSNATLNGSYRTALYYADHVGAQLDTIDLVVPGVPYNSTLQVPFPAYAFNTELVTVSFDGAGNYSMSGTRNQAGSQSQTSGTGTYSVAADGTLTLDIGLTGSVLADGSTFVLAKTSGQPVEIGVGVRR